MKVLDPDVDITTLTEEELDHHMVRTLRRLVISRGIAAEEATDRLYKVGELNSRMVFLAGMGHIHPRLERLVQEVVLPVGKVEDPEEFRQ